MVVSAEARAEVPAQFSYRIGGWERVLCLGSWCLRQRNGAEGARVVLCRSDLYRRRRVNSFIRQRHGLRYPRHSMPNRRVRKHGALFVSWNFGRGTIEHVYTFCIGTGQAKVST